MGGAVLVCGAALALLGAVSVIASPWLQCITIIVCCVLSSHDVDTILSTVYPTIDALLVERNNTLFSRVAYRFGIFGRYSVSISR